MAEYFTADDFERAGLPKGLKKNAYDLIELAVIHGWTARVTSGSSVSIVSPDGRKKYHFSGNRRDTISHERIKKDIIRLADPQRAAVAQTIAARGAEQSLDLMKDMPSLVTGTAEVVDDRPPSKEQKVKAERTIISTTPMLAKAGSKDTAYESETTLVRRWSDGTTDYVCVEGDFEATSRLSVSRHFANAHSRGKGRAPQPPTFKAEVQSAVYAPRQTRVEALAAHLHALWGTEGLTLEEVAKAALTWVHEQSREGTEHAAERESLTPEDMLNRIRTLLDDGTAGRHQNELLELQQQVTYLTAQVEYERERGEAARATLKTLAELAQEEAQEKEAG